MKSSKKVLIIGGGFAGSYCARNLESRFDVTMVDTKDYFEFTPSVLRTLVEPSHSAKIEARHVTYLKETTIICDRVSDLADSYAVLSQTQEKILFDYAIIASGSHYATPIKHENLLLATRAKEFSLYFERVVLAERIVVIGGGIVGVELAAEIILHFPHKKVVIVHSGSELCERLPVKARVYVTQFFEKLGVELVFNERVESASGRTFTTKSGKTFTVDLAFWCTGITPSSEFLKKHFSSVLVKNRSVLVGSTFQIDGHPNIFAIGDVTAIIEEKLAQTAEVHARVAVQNIINLDSSRALIPYVSRSRPMVISLGKYDGVLCYGKLVITGLVPGLLKSAVERLEMRKLTGGFWFVNLFFRLI